LEKSQWTVFLHGQPSSALPRPNPVGKADPHRLFLRDAAKWAPVPHGPHLSASRLRVRETATHTTRYRARYAQTHPLPLLRCRRSSPAKFPSTGRPPVTTLHREDAYVCTCLPEPSRRLWCTVVSHHHCLPTSALVATVSVEADRLAMKSSSRTLR
jgi:hypothetical protein